jgi:hypothetical protein
MQKKRYKICESTVSISYTFPQTQVSAYVCKVTERNGLLVLIRQMVTGGINYNFSDAEQRVSN